MRKKVWIFPVWLWLVLALAGIAAAAFVLTLPFEIGGIAGDAPTVAILQPWSCEFTPLSLGSVDSCDTLPDNLGASTTLSEFDDDSIFNFKSESGANNIRNDDGVDMCPAISDPPPDAPYQAVLTGTAVAGVAPAGTAKLEVRTTFDGLDPGEVVAISFDVTWAPCP